MDNYSSVKKVSELLGTSETILFEERGGRASSFPLEKDRVYIIPKYQREIRWESGNVQTLIDDLGEGKKFLGTVTMSSHSIREFEIIDGQQRLTVIKMLLSYLNLVVPSRKKLSDICRIDNYSFPKFEEVLLKQFNYDEIKEHDPVLYSEIVANDALSQMGSFKEIWDCIRERVSCLDSTQQIKLIESLKESEINVIVNKIDGTDSQKKFCVDYFIDINNKSVALDCLDIIRAYAFKEDFDEMSDKWVDIQTKCNDLSSKVKYTREFLYYQYFICRINEQLGYKLTKLSEKYTIKHDVVLNGKTFSEGTFVWTMFSNDYFYAQLLDDLNDYLDFVKTVTSNETGGFDSFKELFKTDNGSLCDEITILNAHTIINTILRNDDIVPKNLIMKYYLDVLSKPKAKKGMYKIIYNINCIATLFTAKTGGKGSDIIASKILAEDWVKSIRDYSYKQTIDILNNIDLSRINKINRSYTVESGQYMARRYYSIFDAYKWDSGNLQFDENVFRKCVNTDTDKNEEHLLINRTYKYSLYDEDEKPFVEISCPRRLKKYVATIANYLVLNSEINSILKNRPVYEKICIIDSKIKEKGIDYVIPSARSQLHYAAVKEVFFYNTSYPYRELNVATKKAEIKSLLKDYYEKYFEDEFMTLIEILNSEEKIFAANIRYKLVDAGFDREQNDVFWESEIPYRIEADVDSKEEKINLSMTLFNPCYGEMPKEESDVAFSKIVENITNQLDANLAGYDMETGYLGSEDEEVIISYSLPPEISSVKEYVDVLSNLNYE